MKGKFSLNRAMHNDRLMLAFSLLTAIVIWAAVVYGPTHEETHVISNVPVSFSLTNPAAISNGLRVIDSETESVTVTITGPRWIVSKLTKDDIQVKADTSEILAVGDHKVTLSATKTIPDSNYNIESMTPGTAKVHCDIWQENMAFAVTADISKVMLAEELKGKNYQLGEPLMDTQTLQNNTVLVSGPKQVLGRIQKVVAGVEEETKLTDARVFQTKLRAYDADGKEIDLSNCVLSASMVNVTVPVLAYQKVTLDYTTANMPAAFQKKANFFQVSPQTIELLGTPDAVADFAASVGTRTFNFDNLQATDSQITIPLTPPDNVKIIGDVKAITVTFNMKGFTSKTMDLNVTEHNVTLLNKPDKQVSYFKNKLTGIRVMGSAASLRKLTEADLQLVVDMKGNITDGATQYEARIEIPKYSDVWVYYGAQEQNGIEFYVTVES